MSPCNRRAALQRSCLVIDCLREATFEPSMAPFLTIDTYICIATCFWQGIQKMQGEQEEFHCSPGSRPNGRPDERNENVDRCPEPDQLLGG